jgi:lipopolysaccharide export system protein LptA
MYANNKQDIAKFYDKVVLIHVPTDDPNLQLDENHPPPGYLYMSCEKLEVLKNKLADGRTYQEMRAYKKVAIDSQEFSGNADVVKYDESKEQVILEGSDGNLAVLTRQKVRGGRPDTVRGKKIIYWRTTGNYQVDEGREIQVTQ